MAETADENEARGRGQQAPPRTSGAGPAAGDSPQARRRQADGALFNGGTMPASDANTWTPRPVPVTGKYDVVVCGGGPAGFAAAVAAARQGARTLLVEAGGCVGGQGTLGLVGPWMPTFGTEGVFEELLGCMAALNGWKVNVCVCFDSEVLKYAMQTMLEEAGVEQLLFTTAARAVMTGRRVAGVEAVNKAGPGVIEAAVTIDCTGDGDVAASAGAAFEKGGSDGALQNVTLFFVIGGVDDDARSEEAYLAYRAQCAEYCRIERERGALNLPEGILPLMVYKGSTLGKGEYSVNVDTATGVDGSDPWQLTRAMNESRKRVFELVEFFRRYFPGARNCFLSRTASVLGVRETRRFMGLATLTGRDVIEGRKREDSICRASFFLDLHDRGGNQTMKARYGRNRPPDGDWYEIPYGCLVPAGIDGLLLAGRCVSSDRDANGSLRVQPTCMALGQAAGAAAALCIGEGIEPRQVAVEKLRAILASKFSFTLDRPLPHSLG